MEGEFSRIEGGMSGWLISDRCILLACYLDSVGPSVLKIVLSFDSYNHLGFDTASSIALLAVSAIAKKDSDGKQIPSAEIVILPVCYPLSCGPPAAHCHSSCFLQQG
jgi:hypothetical protein